jgi:hypothetical protein
VNAENGRQYWKVTGTFDWKRNPPILGVQHYQKPSGCTSLSQTQAQDITNMIVIGYGTTKEGGSLSSTLRMADVHYVLNPTCDEMYGNKGEVTDDMLCASDVVEKQDACQGDSGGPLFTQLSVDDQQLLRLVGAVSWGEGCARPDAPGVYSRTGLQANWIDEAVCGTNGLSQKSCTPDEDGVMRITDYALNSLSSGARALGAFYGVEWTAEACELLGGNINEPSVPTTSRPTNTPTASPSRPPGTSSTKTYLTKGSPSLKTKALMFEITAPLHSELVIETISVKTGKAGGLVQIYFQPSAYPAGDGSLSKAYWSSPVYSGTPTFVSASGLTVVTLQSAVTISKGQTGSFYLYAKNAAWYSAGSSEFSVADKNSDLEILTGYTTKNAFQTRLKAGNFYGELEYHTLA